MELEKLSQTSGRQIYCVRDRKGKFTINSFQEYYKDFFFKTLIISLCVLWMTKISRLWADPEILISYYLYEPAILTLRRFEPVTTNHRA